MDWARAIRDYRSLNRLTQEEFAAQIGVEPRSLRRWETGNGLPARDRSRQLAEILTPFVSTLEMIEDLVRLSSGKAIMVTPDRTVMSVSPAAKDDLARCGLSAEIGQECKYVPDEALADQLECIWDESVSRFTSEYVAHWQSLSVHVRSDVRVVRMFTAPIVVDLYEAMPVASAFRMAHRLRVV